MKLQNNAVLSILAIMTVGAVGCGHKDSKAVASAPAAVSQPSPSKAKVLEYATAQVVDTTPDPKAKAAADAISPFISENIVTDKSGRCTISHLRGLGLDAEGKLTTDIVNYMTKQPGEGMAILKRAHERALLPEDKGGFNLEDAEAAESAFYLTRNFANESNKGSLKFATVAQFDAWMNKGIADGGFFPAIGGYPETGAVVEEAKTNAPAIK